jgi:glycosyltransferase involved in cell wall biosynthesis
MRVLQINIVYAQGSTGHITETLHKEYLKEGIDSYVLFGRGPKQADKRVVRCSYLWEAKLWRFISLFTGNIYGGVPFSTLHIKHLIKKLHPDVVHLQCINGNMVNIYLLMNWLKKQKIKTVLTHHAEFMYTGGCGVALCPKWKDHCEHCPFKKEVFGRFSIDRSFANWKRFKKAFSSFPLLTNSFVSPWLQGQGLQSPILKNFGTTAVVLNPVNTAIFNDQADASLPKTLDGQSYVLAPFARFFDPNKKSNELENVATSLQEKKLVLAVAGAPKDVQFSNLNIVNLGFVSSPDEMASLYRHAQCTLILSKEESFSMPVAESLCCGTPVVGYKAGGPESFADPSISSFVDQGDTESLIFEISRLSVKRATKGISFSFEPFAIARQYLKLYQN